MFSPQNNGVSVLAFSHISICPGDTRAVRDFMDILYMLYTSNESTLLITSIDFHHRHLFEGILYISSDKLENVSITMLVAYERRKIYGSWDETWVVSVTVFALTC